MTIMVRGELRARPGRRAEFLAVVAALAEAAASEPGTLRYDWYHGEGEDEFVVLEDYTDPAAAVAHNQHCAELLGRVPELADMTAVRLHGDLGPDLDRKSVV